MKNVLVTAILCMTSAGGEIASLSANPAMRRPTAWLMHRDVRSMPDFLESIIGITRKSVTVSFGKTSALYEVSEVIVMLALLRPLHGDHHDHPHPRPVPSRH